jgi:hypothetical protein
MNIPDNFPEGPNLFIILVSYSFPDPGSEIFLVLDPGWKNSDPGLAFRVRKTVANSSDLLRLCTGTRWFIQLFSAEDERIPNSALQICCRVPYLQECGL